ncbi:MAG: hypothetical protein AAGI14_09435 [Pseudomonadota bacterium]
MKLRLGAAAAALSVVTLAGCVHVSDDGLSDLEEISINTETALRVCGGPGTVAEVSEEGFTCKDD